MNKNPIFVLLKCILLLGCSSIARQSSEVNSSIGAAEARVISPAEFIIEDFKYDCDSLAGRYRKTQYDLKESLRSLSVSGRINLLRIETDDKWTPSANMRLNDRSGSQSIVLHVFWEKSRPTELTLGVSYDVDQQTASRKLIGLIPMQDQPIPFEMRLLMDGRIEVSAKDRSVVLDAPRLNFSNIVLSCSTGHFLFDEVSVRPL
jgi:hypothetical protein